MGATMIWMIGADDVANAWPMVSPMLDRVISRNSRYSLESVRAKLDQKTYCLLVAATEKELQSCCIITINEYPAQRWLTIIMCAGDNMVQWLVDGIAFIEKFARWQDCAGIELTGRRGWERALRALGFKRRDMMMEKVF